MTNPGTKLVESEYRRSLLAGADLSVALGGMVLSAEAGVETETVHYTRELLPYWSPEVQYAVSLRYTYGTVVGVDLEFSHDILVTPDEDTLIDRAHDLRIALVAEVRLFRDHLHLGLAGSWDPMQGDLYLNPRLTLVVEDQLDLQLGLQIFEGFGPDIEADLDSIVSYQGGLVGLYRENDYAYASVDWSF